MTDSMSTKKLNTHFNRFVSYRKETEKKGQSFTDKLKLGEVERKSQKHSAAAHLSRRFQPPKLGKAKDITDLQAGRLARYAPLIEQAARKHNVPVELICGVILQESGGNTRAVSSAGARGLMQLMPATARRFGVNNSFDPAQNIEAGTKYLRFLLDKFNGKVDLALAGYNAGEGNVEKYGNKVPPFAETRNYIPNVLGYTQSMINILYAKINKEELPAHARKV